MSQPAAGSSRKGLFSRDDYLAPPHIPTGQPPRDVLNTIWRKNEVFLDIGSYSIGSFVMVMWPPLLLCLWFMPPLERLDVAYGFIIFCFVIFPALMLLYVVAQPVPPPVRFNRQRREVCVPQKDGSYWIVPWEQVTATATAVSSIGQHGKTTQGLLVVGFTNPDPNARDEDKHFSLGFSCGGGTTAMCLWECMRSYMEIGPEATPPAAKLDAGGTFKYYKDYMTQKAKERGWLLTFLWEGVCGFLVFNAPLSMYLQRKKLSPPPDLTDPTIVKWSQPLPPEQWAKRSPELEQAIAKREAELAAA